MLIPQVIKITNAGRVTHCNQLQLVAGAWMVMGLRTRRRRCGSVPVALTAVLYPSSLLLLPENYRLMARPTAEAEAAASIKQGRR